MGTPFYFWLGTSEPHWAYEQGIGLAAGKKLENVDVPAYLPGTPSRIDEGGISPMHDEYHDIDAAPSLDVMTENADGPYFSKYLYLSVGKRPAEELYDIRKDPACVNNLALDADYEQVTA